MADRALMLALNAIRLFYSNADVSNFNTQIALAEVQGAQPARAIDTYIAFKSEEERARAKAKVGKFTHVEMANLPRVIMLARGKPYMITLNIYVKDGLVNGALVMLQAIEYREGDVTEIHVCGSRSTFPALVATRASKLNTHRVATSTWCQTLARVGPH